MNEDLVAQHTQSVLDRYKTGHLWVGLVDPYKYEMYFEQDSLPENELSSFCKDICLNYEYDEDFIILYEPMKVPVGIQDIMPEIPLYDDAEKAKVTERFSLLSINTLNVFVFYSEPTLKVREYKGLSGLYYLGEFNAE